MTFRQPSRKHLQEGCSEIGAGDGLDPRFDRTGPSGRPLGRKSLQLCKQAAQTLQEVLLGCGDDVLRNLEVRSVTPAGGARLLVILRPGPGSAFDVATIQSRLEAAHGLLRSELAGAIHRRKTPDLVFQVDLPEDATS